MIIQKYKLEECKLIIPHHQRKKINPNLQEEITFSKTKYLRKIEPAGALNSNSIKQKIKEVGALNNHIVRRDAVVLIDSTLFAPNLLKQQNIPKRLFFDGVFKHYKNYLEQSGLDIFESQISGYVHYDESIPHIHILYMPIIRDNDNITFSAKRLISRNFLINQVPYLSKELSSDFNQKIDLLNIDQELLNFTSSLVDKRHRVLTLECKNLKNQKDNLKKEVASLKNEKTQLNEQIEILKTKLQNLEA